MAGLAHVALHVALCGPITRLPSQAAFAMHVRVSDKINRTIVDRSFSLERGFENEAIVEFDVPQGVYRIEATTPHYGCSASELAFFIPDHARNFDMHLQSGANRQTDPTPMLLSGTTPAAFTYVHPEFVAVDRGAACNKPIAETLPIRSAIETDQDSYYAKLYSVSQNVATESLNVVLKLRTPAGEFHYVRIPLHFPVAVTGWPGATQMNIPEDYIDTLATEPVDTLLCPKFLVTSVS